MNKFMILLIGAILLFTISCSDDNNTTDPGNGEPPKSIVVKDLNADTTGGKIWIFFSLRENKEIDKADSASTKWDIAFNKTNIICNSGVRGPGNGAIQLLKGVNFSDLTEAPETGYFQEDEFAPLAINKSNPESWYNYSGPPNHVITPKPGFVIVMKTADGKYVKLRIISYYKGAPENPDFDSVPRYYTFEYVYQPDGSRNFN
jgi:hypothetical protein